MAVNLDKPNLWKADIARSVDMYNDWFIKFAPKAFRDTRVQTTKAVEETLKATSNLTNVKPAILRDHPESCRLSACPHARRSLLIGSLAWQAYQESSCIGWKLKRSCRYN